MTASARAVRGTLDRKGKFVADPPESVIAHRIVAMSPAKRIAFGFGCPLCHAYPYRFCFGLGNQKDQVLEAFHEKRWEMAFAATAMSGDQVQ